MHDVAVPGGSALAQIKQKLDATSGGPTIAESVRRHYEHLERLAANLRKLGMDERDIGEEILEVFKQYERALSDYLKAA
jgi:hypothetical protein